MNLIEKKIAKFEAFEIPQDKPADFDSFWEETVAKARSLPLNVKSEIIDYPIKSIEVRDITYEGIDGTLIHTWLLLPPEAKSQKVPVVISYHGASGSRFTPSCHLQWLLMGCAVIVSDFRSQGGLSASKTGFLAGPNQYHLAMGLLDKYTYYYYHFFYIHTF